MILLSTTFEAIYSDLINIQMKYSKLMLLCTHFPDSDDASQATIKCCLQYDSVLYINHHESCSIVSTSSIIFAISLVDYKIPAKNIRFFII